MERELRALLAWFEPADALSALLGFRLPDPGEDVQAQLAVHEAKRRAVLERPAHAPGEAAQPLPPELVPPGEAMLASLLAAEPPEERQRYRVAMVDLGEVLAFQKVIMLDRRDPRLETVEPGDLQQLFDICMPSGRVEEDLDGTYDKDGRGLTITSPNPNLRLGPVQTIEFPPGSGNRIIGCAVLFGSPFMHVVEYQGRYVLKDGYHRAFALLARGIRKVPVILQAARTFADIHRGGTTLIAAEHLLGPRPPRLLDFHDPDVSTTVRQRVFRKVARLRAEEFVINI